MPRKIELSAPMARVASWRRAMRNAEEERTGSAPVAGVVNERTEMSDAGEERTVSARIAGVVI